jgi:hypothetical protein
MVRGWLESNFGEDFEQEETAVPGVSIHLS